MTGRRGATRSFRQPLWTVSYIGFGGIWQSLVNLGRWPILFRSNADHGKIAR